MNEWDRCKAYLEPALDANYTLADVWEEISNDRAQFWPLTRSAVVTQILTFPRRRVLRVWLAGGDLDELRWALGHADDIARSRGCSAIEIDGRKGWARALTGFEPTRIVLTREIE